MACAPVYVQVRQRGTGSTVVLLSSSRRAGPADVAFPGSGALASLAKGLCYRCNTLQDQPGSSPRPCDADVAVSVGCLIRPSYLGGELCSW